MLTYEAAKKMGIDACVEKLGRDFVKMHKDTSYSCFMPNHSRFVQKALTW